MNLQAHLGVRGTTVVIVQPELILVHGGCKLYKQRRLLNDASPGVRHSSAKLLIIGDTIGDTMKVRGANRIAKG